MPLSKDEIVAIVTQEIQAAHGYDSNVLGDMRARANDAYFGNTQSGTIPEAEAGRSNIVSMDVQDTVNSQLAEIIPMFQASMVEFPPNNREDEQQAQMESDFIRDELRKNDFYTQIYNACHSALLQGLGWIKVFAETDEKVTHETYDIAEPDAFQLEQLSIPRVPGEDVEVSAGDGQVSVTRTTPVTKLRIETIAPEHMMYSSDHSQFSLDDRRFIAERKLFTVDTLVREYGMSWDDANSIPTHGQDDYAGTIARQEKYYEESVGYSYGWQDQSRLKECYCCYMDIALSDEGKLEKYYIMVGGSHVIDMRPVNKQPYVCASPVPVPHRTQGRGMYEIMKDVYESKTTLLRNLIDNAMVANSSRTAYNENTVNVTHLTNGRINGVVAVNGIPREHVMQMPATDVTAHVGAVLQYLDEVRSSRGGASVDMNDAEMQTAKSSAEAAYNVKISKEKMAGFYARNLVVGFMQGVYLKAHQTLREDLPGPREAKIRGNWFFTDPGHWKPRTHCTVVPGLTEVERRQKLQNMTMLTGMQQQINQNGGAGILTDISKVYNSMADWIRIANLGEPEEFLLDPTSPESQQTQAERAQQAQAQLVQTQSIMQNEQALEETRIELDKYKHDTELQWKYYKENLDTEENNADNRTRLEVERMKGNGQDDGRDNASAD